MWCRRHFKFCSRAMAGLGHCGPPRGAVCAIYTFTPRLTQSLGYESCSDKGWRDISAPAPPHCRVPSTRPRLPCPPWRPQPGQQRCRWGRRRGAGQRPGASRPRERCAMVHSQATSLVGSQNHNHKYGWHGAHCSDVVPDQRWTGYQLVLVTTIANAIPPTSIRDTRRSEADPMGECPADADCTTARGALE